MFPSQIIDHVWKGTLYCRLFVFLFTTDRDLEELKKSYEHRLEQIKHDTETTVANAMAEADRAMAAVKSLYENQVCPQGNGIVKSLNKRLLVI